MRDLLQQLAEYNEHQEIKGENDETAKVAGNDEHWIQKYEAPAKRVVVVPNPRLQNIMALLARAVLAALLVTVTLTFFRFHFLLPNRDF